jgi:hypothetical protein
LHYLNCPVPDAGAAGNPPALIRLQDGRVCLTYGACLREDGGKTWGEVLHLRADGALVTTYYFNDDIDTERYLAATLWRP